MDKLAPMTVAGKIQLIMQLAGLQEITDEDGNVIEYTKPLISKEDAIKLLEESK